MNNVNNFFLIYINLGYKNRAKRAYTRIREGKNKKMKTLVNIGTCSHPLEKDVEKALVREVRKMGGEAYKWTSPGNDGVPDRIVVLPGGIVVFVELKADGGQLRPVQRVQIEKLRRLGQRVEIVRGMKGLKEFLGEIRAT